jgi:hypothetical protein
MESEQSPEPNPAPVEPIEIPLPISNANQPLNKGLDPDKLERR